MIDYVNQTQSYTTMNTTFVKPIPQYVTHGNKRNSNLNNNALKLENCIRKAYMKIISQKRKSD